MYQKIKQLADEAIALQNKARMEEVLREISGNCWRELQKTLFEDMRIEKFGSESCPECGKLRSKSAAAYDAVTAGPVVIAEKSAVQQLAAAEGYTFPFVPHPESEAAAKVFADAYLEAGATGFAMVETSVDGDGEIAVKHVKPAKKGGAK